MNNRFPGARIVKPAMENICHRAKWIIVNPDRIIENGFVSVENGIIKEISGSPAPAGAVDHGDGVLMPPLINAHTHLELSLFKGAFDTGPGFEQWVRKLIDLKESADPAEIEKEARKAALKMAESGTLYAGDIRSDGFADQLHNKGQNSSLAGGVGFREFIGSMNQSGFDSAETQFYRDDFSEWKDSFACHAPHTCSPALLKMIKQKTEEHKRVFSIHLAESGQETEFITKARGRWAELLTDRGIDFSSWGLPSKSPVVHLHSLGLLDPATLAVHLVRTSEEDLDIIADSGAKVCVCPRSNMNLHSRMPDLAGMIRKGIKPAVGTDSLASCGTLSVLDEISFTAAHADGLSPEILLKMATIYGASALGMEGIAGDLNKGKPGWMVYLPLTASNSTVLLEKITGYESI
ncbi:MAG: amidohydrolase family protein [Thermodesulfobacteriota bacterium]